jgi:Protein of unknown function (DUF3618)
MSETPERIEREMFEIRANMAPDMADLRKHVEPQAIAEQVKKTVRQRLQEAANRVKANLKANLKAKQQEIVDSAKRQMNLARKVGENGDTAPLTDAVRSDPRPLILLAIALAVTLLTVRKVAGGGSQE